MWLAWEYWILEQKLAPRTWDLVQEGQHRVKYDKVSVILCLHIYTNRQVGTPAKDRTVKLVIYQ